MAETETQKVQRELHNRLAGQIAASIVKGPIDAGGSFTDVLVLLESVIVGVIITSVRIGGDNIVLDTVVDRVRDRAKELLAAERLGPVNPQGRG